MEGTISTQQKKDLLIFFLGSKPKTTNEIIDEIFYADHDAQIVRDGWKFYNHLNKLPDKLFKSGEFISKSSKVGKTNKTEKVWQLTDLGVSRFEKIVSEVQNSYNFDQSKHLA